MRHVLEVDEAQLASTGARSWWTCYRRNADDVGRVRVLSRSPVGDLVQVFCDHAAHAQQLHTYLTTRVGLPDSALHVKEIA